MARLLAVVAALRLEADVGGVALVVGGVGGNATARHRAGGSRRPAQVLLAGAVLLKVDQAAACYAAHLHIAPGMF